MKRRGGWEAIRQKRLASEQHKKKLARDRIYKRERYQTLKAHGLCVRCGVRDAQKNRVMCSECILERNQLYGKALDKEDALIECNPKLPRWKKYYEKLKKEKRCVVCKQPLDCTYSIICTICTEKRKASRREKLRLSREKRSRVMLLMLLILARLSHSKQLVK